MHLEVGLCSAPPQQILLQLLSSYTPEASSTPSPGSFLPSVSSGEATSLHLFTNGKEFICQQLHSEWPAWGRHDCLWPKAIQLARLIMWDNTGVLDVSNTVKPAWKNWTNSKTTKQGKSWSSKVSICLFLLTFQLFSPILLVLPSVSSLAGLFPLTSSKWWTQILLEHFQMSYIHIEWILGSSCDDKMYFWSRKTSGRVLSTTHPE